MKNTPTVRDLRLGRRPGHVAAMLCATALCSAFAAPAWAQASGASEDEDVIIVTAQRRSEALEDVPMTVAVVDQDALSAAGVSNLRDLANVTSGYQLGAGGAFPQPAIRGVTTVINGTFENNVAVYVDGLYQPVAQAINIDLPNVESVQVLKGPQGTLYGRNATGGALLLTTISPGELWQAKSEATYARFDDRRVSGYIAGPLSDAVGLSLAGYMRRSDGYMKLASRTTPGKTGCCAIPLKQDAIRAKLKFQLAEALGATFAYNYTRVDDSRTNAYSPIENVPANPYSTRPGGKTLPTTLGVEAYDLGEVMQTRQHEGGLTLDWDVGIGTLKSITGYAQVITHNSFDFDGSYIPSNYTISTIRERTFQQALDLGVNTIDNVDLIVGATYLVDRLKNFGTRNFSGLNPANPGTTPGTLANYVQISFAPGTQKKEAWAVYSDLTFHATDRLSLNVGGRYSKETQDVAASATSSLAVLARPSLTNSASFKKFTPRVSVRYELAPRSNVYASYSQGFRSGAYNLSLPICTQTNPACWQPAKQESIKAFEAGFKTASNVMRFELAGFYYKYSNIQVSTTRTIGGFPVVDITNAPKAKIYGAEANFEYEVIENLNLRAGATWLHARYGSGFSFGGVGVSNAGGVGINLNSDPLKTYLNVSQVQDLSGLQMSRAPNLTANVGLDYLIPNGDGGLRFAVNAKYTDSYVLTNPSIWGAAAGVPVDRQRQQRFREGKYALLSASVTWTDPTDSYYLRLWGNNLTDHRYRLHYSGTATNGTYSPMAEPRTYGATIGFKFKQAGEEVLPPPPPTPAPTPTPTEPPPPQVQACAKGPYIVFFDWDRSDITAEAATVLDSAVGAYANCNHIPIMLAGHADRSGSAAYNVGLSERRNGSVRSYLTARGIADGAISSQGFGESSNRVPTSDGVRELQNRRVEITYGPGAGM